MIVRVIITIAVWLITAGDVAVSQHSAMPPAGPPLNGNNGPGSHLNKSRSTSADIDRPSTWIKKGQAQGLWQTLIILIDFPDYQWDHQDDGNFQNQDSLYTSQHYQEMLFSIDSYKDPYSVSEITGSMRDFYRENSYGQFDIDGVVTKWYRASQPLSYYVGNNTGRGAYPGNAQSLAEEAVELADADVDFSQFDNNGDNRVDGLFIVHAGPGAEGVYTTNFPEHDRYLWSIKWQIVNKILDDVTISEFTLEPEDGTIGVFCHEFGHALGLPDLYDADDSNGKSEGIGEWGLMGGGGWCHRESDELGTSPSHFTAWSKARLGWLSPVNVTEAMQGVRIVPVETAPVVYRLWTAGEMGQQYFLIENRQTIGFDAGLTRRQKDFDLADPNGLLITHVDGQGRQSDQTRRLVDVEEASPLFNGAQVIEQMDLERILPEHIFLNNGNRGDNGDPFPGFAQVDENNTDYLGARILDRFDDSSIPSSADNDGQPTFVSVSNIRLDGFDVIADLAVNSVPTSVSGQSTSLPEFFVLNQNFPNPFNPATTIRFSITRPGRVALKVYGVDGRLVKTLLDEQKSPGNYTAIWNGRNQEGSTVASGLYIYRLSNGSATLSGKMLLLR